MYRCWSPIFDYNVKFRRSWSKSSLSLLFDISIHPLFQISQMESIGNFQHGFPLVFCWQSLGKQCIYHQNTYVPKEKSSTFAID